MPRRKAAGKKAVPPAARKAKSPGGWRVYLVRCADGTLYTGIARDLQRRIGEHNAGRGAKYTRSRRPVTLVWSKRAKDRSSAQREEARVRRMDRASKLGMIGKTRCKAQ